MRKNAHIIFFFLFILAGISNLFSQTATNPNGKNTFYYDNGNKSSEGNMVNGKPDGYWKSYYQNGVLKNEGNRKNFQLDSVWKFYNDKGKITKTINYSEGKKNGFTNTYDTAGFITVKENYINDSKQGTSYNLYPSGKVKQSIPYKNGRADGISYIFTEDSLITTIIRYKMGYVEKLEKINQTDEKGNKQGIWKEFYPDGTVKKETRYKDGTIDGYVKEYDKKGDLADMKKYSFGKEVQNAPELAKPDIFKAFFDDGNVRYEGLYLNGMPIGTHYKFHLSKRCDSVRVYNDSNETYTMQYKCFNLSVADSAFVYQEGYLVERGPVDSLRRRQKIWMEYNITGEFRSKGPYVDDKRIGNWEFFYPNGKTEQKGKYDKRGRAQGEWVLYYDNGAVFRKENYQNDKREGLMEEYAEDGKLITKGEYMDDQKEGDWYYEIGNYKEYGVYHSGMPDSIWKAYYVKENKLRWEGGFLNGDPNGKHVYYYENGKVEASGKYTAGQKDGDWKYFEENGFLILTITYEAGQEVKWDGQKISFPNEEGLKVFEDTKKNQRPENTSEEENKK
ncbi:MAG: toxin-antitoxin system YwqK family antitoxin [Bacteroidia bacterium]